MIATSKRYFILIVLIAVTIPSFSQKVYIKGKAKGAEGMKLMVYAYTDLLTNTQERIATGNIDSSGNFNFTANVSSVTYSHLQIDFSKAPIYLEPGKVYNLDIECKDCKAADDKRNPYLDPKLLSVIITNSDSAELNNCIMIVDRDYDAFVRKSIVKLIKTRKRTLADTFLLAENKKLSYVNNSFLTDYIKYRSGSIEMLAQVGNTALIKKYIWNKDVLYNQPAYMELFDDVFDNFVMSSNSIRPYDIETAINTDKSWDALLDVLGKDSLLRNEVVREMVALKSIGELYYSREYSKPSILGMFNEVIANDNFPQHKIIARNYLKRITNLDTNTVAMDLEMKDYNGKTHHILDSNATKYVYLIFYTSWCIPCMNDIAIISKIKSKYSNIVDFVGVSVDKDFLTYMYFMQKNKVINFTTMHSGRNFDLLDFYSVKTYPTYVMISPGGKIYKFPATAPNAGLEEQLKFLQSKLEPHMKEVKTGVK